MCCRWDISEASKPDASERDPVKHSAFRSVFCPSPVNFQRFRYVPILFALSIHIHTPSVRDAVHPHPASPTKHPLWTTMNPSTTQHPNTTSTVSGKYQNAATPGQIMDRPHDGGIPRRLYVYILPTRPNTPPERGAGYAVGWQRSPGSGYNFLIFSFSGSVFSSFFFDTYHRRTQRNG